MAGAVLLFRWALERAGLFEWLLPAVAALVALGAGCYFLVLTAVSRRFRRTVVRNLPVDIRW
ncbi:hypothetical protein [Natronomonas pharaonis]|uniref:hypothetical protein n=1 Tax=Natronomonas pharaonis TaxID=2257 RepID=UPI0006782BED|nr:hypothetical protein [Natronomonas pharaonis]